MNTSKKTPLQIAIRAIIIIVIIILLLLLTLGIVKVLPKAFNSLNRARTSLTETATSTANLINVSVSPAVFSKNQEGIVTWTRNGGRNTGFYTFQYSCAEGIVIEKEDGDDTKFKALDCGKAIRISDAATTTGSLFIHGINNAPHDSETTLMISHVRRSFFKNETYAVGTTSLKIAARENNSENNEDPSTVDLGATTTKPVITPATTTVRVKPRPTPPPTYNAGPADLAVAITSITKASDGRINVHFKISNYGERSSGAYRFRAHLPTVVVSNRIYDSAYQSSIPRGGTSYFTLGFYGLRDDYQEFIVTADPNNQIIEKSEANNESRSLMTFTTK